MMPNKELPIFFDVDDTLWSRHGNVMWASVELARKFKTDGYKLVLWSYGGESHCHEFVAMSCTEDLWDVIIGKPQVMVDDAPTDLMFARVIYPPKDYGVKFETDQADRLP